MQSGFATHTVPSKESHTNSMLGQRDIEAIRSVKNEILGFSPFQNGASMKAQ